MTRHRVNRALAMGRPMETGNVQGKIGTRSGARPGSQSLKLRNSFARATLLVISTAVPDTTWGGDSFLVCLTLAPWFLLFCVVGRPPLSRGPLPGGKPPLIRHLLRGCRTRPAWLLISGL